MKNNGWCQYFDEIKRICSIYEKRPVACRVASCRFIEKGKIPEEIFKIMNKRDIKGKCGV